jgi:hypothetical protein
VQGEAALPAPSAGSAAAAAQSPAQPPDESPRELPELPIARPILALDDTRTHGPTARNFVDLSLDSSWIAAPGDDVESFAAQLSAGIPTLGIRDVDALTAPYSQYQVRVRAMALHTAGGWTGGPLTLAIQRYAPIGPVAMAPLAHAHTGIELAVSTPWLADRLAVPPRPVQVVDAVDTELAGNGWSLRPLSGYLRVDFLACRTVYFETGGAPELFVPTAGPTEYDARYHVAFGWSFGCAHRVTVWRPKLVVEYRGRIRLHAADEPVAYHDSIGVGAQLDVAGGVVQVLGTTNPGRDMDDHGAITVRLQFGLGKGD